jgi:GAF domain-containing protein
MTAQPADMAVTLAAIARRLAESTPDDALLEITNTAVDSMSGVDYAAIGYLDGAKVAIRVQSDPIMTIVDDLQTELQQGPCLHALTAEVPVVRVDDLATDDRWPEFGREAVRMGIRSGRSFRLSVSGRTFGVLSLFSRDASAFSSDTEVLGELFATHASVALAGRRRVEEFAEAVRHRDVIGQAKGVLMARHGLDEEEAFATLVRFSQNEHLKLYEVARRLMATVVSERNGRDIAGV